MAAFVPIAYRVDGSYFICCQVSKKHSHFVEYEYVTRDGFEAVVREAGSHGEVIEPYISYGMN